MTPKQGYREEYKKRLNKTARCLKFLIPMHEENVSDDFNSE